MDDSIHIKGLVFHKSFVNTYKGMTLINARRELKRWYTKSQQDAILKYLKEQKIIINYEAIQSQG